LAAAAVVGILVAVAAGLGASPPAALPTTVPADRPSLQADLDLAQQIIDDPASPAAAVAGAGRFEQLATAALAGRPRGAQRAVINGLAPAAATAIRADLDASTALSRLDVRHKRLPPWRIEPPPAPDTLLGYFKAAEASSGVPWQYLAAIEFVETRFGRVHGLSTAGAEGPMQFLPTTWARYGRGDVRDPRDAIFGAARYLTANGAPHDMAGALLHYNPSRDYVRAVTDYAASMRADQRAYYGYYAWQVLYVRRGRLLLLPEGYPKLPAVAVTLPGGPRSG
jgi:membrane-bound lytic murein transglycosylase B